ncbi:hypothetical protein GCM10020218_002030 [Dactylosporangium vinaceum]
MNAIGIDWGRVEHAYGPAVDTPGHLAALLGPIGAPPRGPSIISNGWCCTGPSRSRRVIEAGPASSRCRADGSDNIFSKSVSFYVSGVYTPGGLCKHSPRPGRPVGCRPSAPGLRAKGNSGDAG